MLSTRRFGSLSVQNMLGIHHVMLVFNLIGHFRYVLSVIWLEIIWSILLICGLDSTNSIRRFSAWYVDVGWVQGTLQLASPFVG